MRGSHLHQQENKAHLQLHLQLSFEQDGHPTHQLIQVDNSIEIRVEPRKYPKGELLRLAKEDIEVTESRFVWQQNDEHLQC
jgi:hypothetical protein